MSIAQAKSCRRENDHGIPPEAAVPFGWIPDPVHLMTGRPSCPPFYARKRYRWLAGIFGLFLIGVGIYAVLLTGGSSMLRFVAGFALGVLGGNMVLSACLGRESWLSRLGPLP